MFVGHPGHESRRTTAGQVRGGETTGATSPPRRPPRSTDKKLEVRSRTSAVDAAINRRLLVVVDARDSPAAGGG